MNVLPSLEIKPHWGGGKFYFKKFYMNGPLFRHAIMIINACNYINLTLVWSEPCAGGVSRVIQLMGAQVLGLGL